MSTDYATMTEDEAARRIEKAVYQATSLLERLETAGRLKGNGHHVRQEAAAAVAVLLRKRFRGGTTEGGE